MLLLLESLVSDVFLRKKQASFLEVPDFSITAPLKKLVDEN